MRLEIGIAAQPLLNRVLDDDTVDRGYVRTLFDAIIILLTSGLDLLYLHLSGIRQC